MNIIRKFIEKLLYTNRQVIVFEKNGVNSSIIVFNIDPAERIKLAVLTVIELIKGDCKYYNLSYKDKVEIVRNIIEVIGEQTKVDININKED